jgi:hypothetical protein
VFRSRLPKRGYYNSILAWVGRAAYTKDVVLNEEAMSTYTKWPALLLNFSHLTCSTFRPCALLEKCLALSPALLCHIGIQTQGLGLLSCISLSPAAEGYKPLSEKSWAFGP